MVLTFWSGDYTPNDPNHQAVGLFSITYYWRAVLKDVLPSGSNGVIVVFDGCKESFTYQINGANTLYLGVGDRHQAKYDKYELTSKLTDLTIATNVVPIADDYCSYTIRICPSDTFRDMYSSQRPIIITCVAVLIFAMLHTLVFLSYDKLVQHRNKVSKKNNGDMTHNCCLLSSPNIVVWFIIQIACYCFQLVMRKAT